jgi:hypothetical protein
VTFRAPWSLHLKLTTGFAVVAIVFAMWTISRVPDAPSVDWLLPLLVAVFVGCALTAVRGYEITPDAIVVKRLIWTTRLPRNGLTGARRVTIQWPHWRLFGNGGMFAFSGWFRSSGIGTYHGFFTDPSRTVLLEYGEKRYVLSPDEPEGFVSELSSRRR